MAYFHKLLAKLKQKKSDDSRLGVNPHMVPLIVGSEADIHFWSPSNDRFSQTEIGIVQLFLKTLYFLSVRDLTTAKEVCSFEAERFSLICKVQQLLFFADRYHCGHRQRQNRQLASRRD